MHFHLSESDRYLETVNDPICLKRIEAIKNLRPILTKPLRQLTTTLISISVTIILF